MKSMQRLSDTGRWTFLLDTLTGALLCAWFALTAALVARTWPHPVALALLLVPAVGWVARVWGMPGAMLGLASAIAVSSLALFVPIGSFDVDSAEARTALFWMALLGGVAAYVLGRARGVHTDVITEMKRAE